MKNELVKFEFQTKEVRTTTDEIGQVWFAGIDICNILGYADSHQALKKLSDKQKKLDRTKYGLPGSTGVQTVNLGGVFKLIISSRKPIASLFEEWLLDVVLPEAHRRSQLTDGELMNKDLELQRISKELDEVEEKISEFKGKIRDLNCDRDQLVAKLKQVINCNPKQLQLKL